MKFKYLNIQTLKYASGLVFGVLFLFLASPHAFAAGSGFVPLAHIPGLTDPSTTSVVNSASLAMFFNNLYRYLIGLAAIIAVVEIIWAGLDIAYYHKDAVAEITEDKGRIRNAVFGLVLVLSPAIVFGIINPSILNLSLDLPPLDTRSSSSGSSNPLQTTVSAGKGQLKNGDDFFICTPSDAIRQCVQAKTSCAGTCASGFTSSSNLMCIKSDGSIGSTPSGTSCQTGETIVVHCLCSPLAP